MRRLVPIAVLTACLALTACGGGSPGRGERGSFDLTIGVLVPLRGDLASFGPSGRQAAASAGLFINKANRNNGNRIRTRIIYADSESQPIPATIAARKLVKRGATCLVGDWSSASTIAVGNQIAAKEGIPLISPASTNFGISRLDDRGYVFRTAPSDALQVIALADLAERSIGGARGKTVSLAARDDAYGREVTRRFAAVWRRRGGHVAGPVLYDPTAPSYADAARRIVAGDPDAFVVADFPETYARLAPALLATGSFDASKLLVTDTLAVENAAAWDIPAAALAGAQGVRPGVPEDRWADSFNRFFRSSQFDPDKARIEPEPFAAQTYDATILCYLAAVAAGSKDPGAIKAQIARVANPPGKPVPWPLPDDGYASLRTGHDIDYRGTSGPVNFDGNGDVTSASYEALRYSGAGSPRGTGVTRVP